MAYNDYFGPVIYLTDDTKWTVSVALSHFQGSPRIGPQMQLTMAATTLAAIPSILLFIFAQRHFHEGHRDERCQPLNSHKTKGTQ